MANKLTFTQTATILNQMLRYATGKDDLVVAVNETEFVAQANTMLLMGYEQFTNAMSQTLSRTIWSNRPYSRKMRDLYADEIRYGNHVRKENAIDGEFEDDQTINLVDGTSVDPWRINKPKVIQTNWYGQNVYQVLKTLPRDQINTAISSSGEFGSFITMVLTNVSDMIEQKHEVTARATLCNLIGAKVKCDPDNVIYLVDEYVEEKGITDPDFDYRTPANYGDFARWLYGYIETLSDDLEERGILYHKNITGKEISRHTPKSEQILYVISKVINHIQTEVKSVTFNPEFLKAIRYERVSYWQSPKDKTRVSVIPNYIDDNGQLVDDDSSAVDISDVFGVLFDRECCGYTTINNWSQSTGLNPAGGYTNTFWHFTDRPWLDLTENAIVLVLGKKTTNTIEPVTVGVPAGSTTTYGHKVNTYQTGVQVNGDEVTGTLKFVQGGLAETGPLAGDGYFLALNWSEPAAGITSIKLGLNPSMGTGLVEGIGDQDRIIVCKVTDKNTQDFYVVQSDGTHKLTQGFDLSGLTLN